MERKEKTRRFMVIAVLMTFFGMPAIWAGGAREEVVTTPLSDYEQWLVSAELGPHQPATEDWEAIARAAQDEPPLVLYTETSRSFPMLDAFKERYGIEVEAINLRGTELIERVRREHASGIRNVGVLMVGSGEVVYDQLLERNAVVNYVPRELQATMTAGAQDPLLVHRYAIGTWYYKNDADPNTPPYENIWAFTTPEWRNRVALNSPLASGTTMAYFIGLAHNADEMARLYQEYFGRPIELSERNAGLEFIKRLLENDARVVPAFRDVSEAVTQGQGFFAGFGAHSAYAGVVRGEYDFNLDTQVAPAVVSARIFAIGAEIEAPNTAKLLIRWFMSQEGGSPWWGDDFAANPAVQQTGFMEELSLNDFAKLWDSPLDVRLQLRDEVADIFLLYQ